MRVTLLQAADAKAKGIPFTSPTAISAHLECQRKWAWRYIGKISSPQHASAALGTDTHEQLEGYLMHGKAIDFTRPSGDILQSGLHLFPSPGTVGMRGEGEFHFLSERTGFIYMGKKDVELPPGQPQVQLDFDGLCPIVLDLKTTASISSYAKSKDDLLFDPQSAMYGFDAMTRYETSSVDLGWIYCQTKGTKKSKPVTLRLGLEHATKCFDAVESITETMFRAREAAKQFEHASDFIRTLPANPSACSAYGGCPYQPLCKLSPSQKARANMSGNSLIASLRSRVQGAEAPVILPTPAVKESLLGDPTQVPAPSEVPACFKEEKTADYAINPPESLLPQAPLPEKASAEDEKPKKASRAKKPATVPAPTVATAPVTPIVHVDESGGPFHLYVDCLPDGREVVYADELIDSANEIIVTRQATTNEPVAHYKFLSFGKASGALELALQEVIDNAKGLDHVFCASTSDALATLTKRAGRITRSVR